MNNFERLNLMMSTSRFCGSGFDEADALFVQEAIISDQTWALNWRFDYLNAEGHPKDDAVEEAVRILTMFRSIDKSIAKGRGADLSPSELGRLEFDGFDGNEDQHFGIAQFLIASLQRFEERDLSQLNSHSCVLPRYRQMLKKFDCMECRRGLLEEDQLRTLSKLGE